MNTEPYVSCHTFRLVAKEALLGRRNGGRRLSTENCSRYRSAGILAQAFNLSISLFTGQLHKLLLKAGMASLELLMSACA
jgi:hypothetical protein